MVEAAEQGCCRLTPSPHEHPTQAFGVKVVRPAGRSTLTPNARAGQELRRGRPGEGLS